MKYYLYKYSDNWADEMDVEGFWVMTEKEKEQVLKYINKKFKKGGTVYLGTNEEIEYDNLRDVMRTFSFKEITRKEYDVLNKLFGGSFGETGPVDDDSFEVECCENCGYELDEDEVEDGICESCAEEDEVELCESCGCELEEWECEMCESCSEENDEEEKAYELKADTIVNFIKSEYGIEETNSSEYYSLFRWKPTPKTHIQITLSCFDSDEIGEVEISLNSDKKQLEYQYFALPNISDNPGKYIRPTIKKFIESAKKHQ